MKSLESSCVYPVPKGWSLYSVDAIKADEANSCVAGPFGSEISSRYFVDEGVPVIRGSNLKDDLTRFVPEGFAFVSDDRARHYQPQHVRANDLVFTCWGTVGQVGLIPADGPYSEYIISNKQLKLRVNQHLADPLFCFYYFASPAYAGYVRNRGIGGAVPGINLGILKSLLIALPPLPVQKRIASLLGAYDDLIQNNRRRMKLLEEAARQLYQEWFVRLRFPGHMHTHVIDGVPEAWERRPLAECLTLKRGHDLPEAKRVPGTIPIVSSSGITGFHAEKKADGPGIVTGRYGTLGQVYFVEGDYWPHNTALYVSDFKGNSPRVLFYFLKQVLENAQSTNAAVPGLYRNVLHTLKVLWPSATLRKHFDEFVEPVFRQLGILRRMNEKLRAARNLLLPRLMSGEIAV